MVTGETGQLLLTVLIPVAVEHNIVYGTVTIQAQHLVVCGARVTGRTLRSVTQIHAQVWRNYSSKIFWSLM